MSEAPTDRDRVRPQDVDIGALLGVAWARLPPPASEFADRVGSKVTLMTTLAEVAMLVFAAPLSWLRADATPESDRDPS